MARHKDRNRLQPILVPQDMWRRAEIAARDGITAHVLGFLGVYRGNVHALAVACYLQGLLDAARMADQHPGWPWTMPEPGGDDGG